MSWYNVNINITTWRVFKTLKNLKELDIMYYGDQRESMVNISYALEGKGWEIFGYSADQSDSQSDYYHPASWEGIATKNGFVLCVDIKDYQFQNSGKKVYEYTKDYANVADHSKIQKLQALANDSAASPEEKDTALRFIEKLHNNQETKDQDREATRVLKYTYPTFQVNPPSCNWHVEKDGVILAKGKGAFQFSDLPYDYDCSTGLQKTWRSREWTPDEKEQKAINKFLSFVAKINNVASGVVNMGDGTDETEQEGLEAEKNSGYETITVTEYKSEIQANEIETPETLIVGMHFKLKASFTHCNSGDIYVITTIRENKYNNKWYITASRMNRKLNKVLTGRATASNNFDCELEKLNTWIGKKYIAIVELEEVKTPYQVQKCVKIAKDKATKSTQKKTKIEDEKTENPITPDHEECQEEVLNSDISDTTLINEESSTEFIQASKRQLYALYLGTKIKTTNLVISKEKAGELISKSIKGINITEELQAIINGDIFITEASEPLPDLEEEQEEEIKTMENFDDILSKFDDIEVKNSSRISLDDQAFCEEQERGYNEFIKFSNNYLGYLKENILSNTFFNSESLIGEMSKTRDHKKNDFVSKIVSYFRDKYKVTLDSKLVQNKYDTNIDYDTIVNEIIEQLGGYNFIDKAEKEIKDEFKNTLKYDKIKLKNTKISIESFFQVDYFSIKYGTYEVGYGSDEKFYKLFKAMSHFLYESNENLFDNVYSTITRKQNDDVFRTHEITGKDIIKTLKVYKNGKIDLEFSNTEHMRKFAKEYCGYTGEMVAK